MIGRAFDTTVPAAVVVGAVAIAFAVGLVVLDVVADQVGQRESVVDRYQVDRGDWPAAPRVQI